MSLLETAEENLICPNNSNLHITLRAKDLGAQEKLIEELTLSLKISTITAKILVSRNINSVEEAKNFLNPTIRHQLPDPSQIKNIKSAAQIILASVKNQEVITIFSDFDVDGISSGSQLYLFLKALGAKVACYIPSRLTEGYGLNLIAVENIAKAGCNLLITVDCGISSNREIARAKQLGMKAIILDHHLPHGELPVADAVVDPAQGDCPFEEHKVAAAGLIWLLLIVLRQEIKLENILPEEKIPDPKDFLDLAALGTICDMVPLTAINRVIAYRGVEALKETKRPGIIALKNVASADNKARFNSGHVAFGLGPRINAAGRLDDASKVFQMLTTDDSLLAKSIAESIDKLNTKRRKIEVNCLDDCIKRIQNQPALLEHSALALFDKDYHIGVIGIVAQKLIEKFHRPTAIMGLGEITSLTGETRAVVKGSVRGIKGFHVAEALSAVKELLITHGGHKEAGGFSLEVSNLEEFKKAFCLEAGKTLSKENLKKRINADLIVALRDIDYNLVLELQKLSPFGVGNPSPVLIAEEVEISSVSFLNDKHLKLRVSDSSFSINAVAWGQQENKLLRNGKRVSIAFSPEINSYQGVASVQISIKEAW